jgi:hypothetical protein
MAADRRMAEEFDLALSAGPKARATSAQPGPHLELVALAQRVAATSRALPGMDEHFRQELRARLVELTPRHTASGATVPAQRGGRHAGLRRAGAAGGADRGEDSGHGAASSPWRRRLLAAGVGMAVATGSVGGVAIASSRALPGDPLYSAKKMFENIQLSLSGSPTDRGQEYLKLADIRLGELDTLLARPDATAANSPTAAYLAQTLDDLQTMIADGGSLLLEQIKSDGDVNALHVLSDFLLTERQRVVDLTWQLPTSLQDQPARIVALMDYLYQQLQQAAVHMPSPGSAPVGSGSAGTGPDGQQGGVGSAPGTRAGGRQPSATGPASTAQAGSASAASAAASDGGTPTPTSTDSEPTTPSPSASSSIGITLPLPILPSTGVDVPPLLGLPGIDIGLGGGGSSPTPTD